MQKVTHFSFFPFCFTFLHIQHSDICIKKEILSEDLKITLTANITITHYENIPMQYTAIFHGCKNDNFQMKNCIFFLFLLKTLIVGTR